MEKINIAELLKDCPQGMELDCTMFDGVYFDHVDDLRHNSIKCYVNNGNEHFEIALDEHGQYISNNSAKCVIFPKGKTTWEGFQRPFKDGDIVFYDNCVFIFKEWVDETLLRTYAYTYLGYEETLCKEKPVFGKDIRKEVRFATEEEKSKLFYSIKANDYKWNPETKTLEELVELKFKVGDRIRHKTHIRQGNVVTEIKDTHYILDNELALPFISQDDYELVHDKFDINTLVPFESRVLVRGDKSSYWKPAIFGCYIENMRIPYYALGGTCWHQCIPYEGNEHLLGKIDDCDEYFKIWK